MKRKRASTKVRQARQQRQTGADPVNFNEQMRRVFEEIPTKGKRVKTNLARILMDERE